MSDKRHDPALATHFFYQGDAERYGVPEAIILQRLRWMIHHNESHGRYEHDGRTWCYATRSGLQQTYTYWSRHQIGRYLKKLVDAGAIRCEQLGRVFSSAWNKTNYYALEDEHTPEDPVRDTSFSMEHDPSVEETISLPRESEITPHSYSKSYSNSSNKEVLTNEKASSIPPRARARETASPVASLPVLFESPKYTFDEFWDAYAYKVGSKRKCKAKFDKLTDVERSLIQQHVPLYVARTYTDGTYPSRCHPATYLNQARWETEVPPKQTQRNGSIQARTIRFGVEEAAERVEGALRILAAQGRDVHATTPGVSAHLGRLDDEGSRPPRLTGGQGR